MLTRLRHLGQRTLKNLYKYVLRRALGNFLAKQLGVEQLEVQLDTREGHLVLTDLEINVDTVNERLEEKCGASPYRLAAGRLGSVSVSICYEKLLAESFALRLSGVELLLESVPASAAATARNKREAAEHDADGGAHEGADAREGVASVRGGSDEAARRALMGDEQLGEDSGLRIIAEWIEQISTKMRIEVDGLTVRLRDRPGVVICVYTPSVRYFDASEQYMMSMSMTMTGGSASSAIVHKAHLEGSDTDGRPVRLPVLESDDEMLMEVRLRQSMAGTGQGVQAVDGVKVDMYVLFKGVRIRLSPRVVRDMVGVGKHIAEVEPPIAEGLSAEKDAAVPEEMEDGKELDFKKIEEYLFQYARERGLHRRGRVSRMEDDVEFFDCTEPGDSALLQSFSEYSQQSDTTTSFRLRVHVASATVQVYQSDVDLLSATPATLSLRLGLREVHLTAVGGAAGTSAEICMRELAVVEEGRTAGGAQVNRSILQLKAPRSEADMPLKGNVEMRRKDDAGGAGGGGAVEETGRGSESLSTIVTLSCSPVMSELSLPSLKQWLRLYTQQRCGGSEGGSWSLTIRSPRLVVALPLTPALLASPTVVALQACMAESEEQRERWVRDLAAKGASIEAVLEKVTLEAHDTGTFALRMQRAVLSLLMGMDGEEGGVGRLRVVVAEPEEHGQGPFFTLGDYALCERFASSLLRTLVPRMREWEAVELNGDLLGSDHRALPADLSTALHLHLPHVTVELTHVERMAFVHLMVALIEHGEEEREGCVNSAPRQQKHASDGKSHSQQVPFLITTKSAVLVVHETQHTAMEPQSRAAREGPCTIAAVFDCLCFYTVSTSPVNSHCRITATDLTVSEAVNHGRVQPLKELKHIPVVYRNTSFEGNHMPEVQGESPPLVVLDVIKAGASSGSHSFMSSMYLDLYGGALRYRVESTWLPRLLALVAGGLDTLREDVRLRCEEMAADRAPSTCVYEAVDRDAGAAEEGSLATDQPPAPQMAMFRVFCTAFDSVIDYASETPEGRAALSVGFARVSSNIVPGAILQGYKIMLRDLVLHMNADRADYSAEDAGVCGATVLGLRPADDDFRFDSPEATTTTAGQLRSASLFSLDAPSPFAAVGSRGGVSEKQFLERGGFVQLATLNFIDAFLRCRTSSGALAHCKDPHVNVDVSVGLLHVYTCGDSLSTLQQVCAGCWLRLNEDRQASVPSRPPRVKHATPTVAATAVSGVEGQSDHAHAAGEQHPSASTTAEEEHAGQSGSPPQPIAEAVPISILGDIDPEMFVPVAGDAGRQADKARREESGAGRSHGHDAHGVEGARPQRGLGQVVIDDFYQVGVEKASISAVPGPPSMEPELDNEDLPEWRGGWLPADDEMDLAYDQSLLVEVTELDASETASVTAESSVGGGSSSDSNLAPIDEEMMAAAEVLEDEQSVKLESLDYAKPGGLFGDTGEVVKGLGMEVELDPLSCFTHVGSGGGYNSFYPSDEEEGDEAAESEPNVVPEAPPQGQGVAHAAPVIENSAPHDVEQEHPSPQQTPSPQSSGGEDGDAAWAWENKMQPSQDQDSRWLTEAIRIYPHHVPQGADSPELSSRLLDGEGGGREKDTQDGGANVPSSGCDLSHIQFRLVLHDLSVSWRMFDGHDWEQWEDGRENNSMQEHSQDDADVGPAADRRAALLRSLLGDSEADTVGGISASSRRPRRRVRGTSARNVECMVEVCLSHVCARVDSFVPGHDTASSLFIGIRDFHVLDRILTAQPRRIIGYWRSDTQHPREVDQRMLDLELTAVLPATDACVGAAATAPMEEHLLRVRLLPLRCHLDQSTVEFLMRFFTMAGSCAVAMGPEALAEALGPFFQLADIRGVKLKLDTQTRPLDIKAMQRGNYMELLNLCPLRAVQLVLQRVQLRGVVGWGSVLDGVRLSWVADITQKQLYKILAGPSPIRSVMNVGSGVADLVLVPLREYRKDGRLLRGLRKGTVRCLKGLAMETLNISYHVTRTLASTLNELVTADGSDVRSRRLALPDPQPKGIRDSLEHAYDSFSRGLNTAAHTIIAIPIQELDRSGPRGSVKAVIRALPIAIVKPVVGATEALCFTLLGARNLVDPDARRHWGELWDCGDSDT